jgi:hypothetical protein
MTETEHTEASLIDCIHNTYPYDASRPRFIVAVQVRNAAGFSAYRMLDAVVLDTWPSTGLEFRGFEIKTNKADLRRELQSPQKFTDFAKHLDYFSILAPKGLVDLKLLPPKWGLYLPTDDGKIRARRRPLPLHDGIVPKEVSRSFAAAFVRALVTRSLSNEAKAAEYNRGKESGKLDAKWAREKAEDEARDLTGAIDKFEEASGIRIHKYNAQKLGEAVELIMDGGLTRKFRYIGNIRETGQKLITMADELENLKQMYDQADPDLGEQLLADQLEHHIPQEGKNA